jgi:phage terminase large subunit
MRDMIDILKENELYDERNHNKTENIYKFKNGSIIEFFSIDDEQKIRGRKRDVLWANEANELNFEEFNQLNMRTTTKLIFDFNPSDLYHWLYDLMLKDESIKIHSTYKDNPFLEEAIVKQIEDLKNVDEEYYKIYTLGEQALAKSTIYSHQIEFTDYPEDISVFVYGLDFGYNHPTALIKVSKNDNSIYGEEIIYQSHLTTSDLINLMNQLEIDKNKYILCDTARPEIIQELRRSGYNVINANKNVKEGIDAVKSSILYLKNDSLNLWKEIRTYKWKTQGEKILDEPVKINDDAMDALRYGILYLKKSISKGINSSFVSFSI